MHRLSSRVIEVRRHRICTSEKLDHDSNNHNSSNGINDDSSAHASTPASGSKFISRQLHDLDGLINQRRLELSELKKANRQRLEEVHQVLIEVLSGDDIHSIKHYVCPYVRRCASHLPARDDADDQDEQQYPQGGHFPEGHVFLCPIAFGIE